MESARQDTGGAARHQCQRGDGVQSARSAVGALRQPDQCAQKLLANKQKYGDSPIQSIVTGLHERGEPSCAGQGGKMDGGGSSRLRECRRQRQKRWSK